MKVPYTVELLGKTYKVEVERGDKKQKETHAARIEASKLYLKETGSNIRVSTLVTLCKIRVSEKHDRRVKYIWDELIEDFTALKGGKR